MTLYVCVCVRMREEQHQQVMRRRQEMEREAVASVMSKKAADTAASAASSGAGGSAQRLDETAPVGRTTRQNAEAANKTDAIDKQKLRFVFV